MPHAIICLTHCRFNSHLKASRAQPRDHRYCIWVSQLNDPTRCFRQFQTYLNTVGIGAPSEADDDDSYSGSASEVDEQPYAFTPRRTQEPAAKIPRVDDTKWKAGLLKNPTEKIALRETCAICLALPPRICFKNCGHCCCCAECALNIKDSRCPLCRAPVDKATDIIRLFAG